MEKSTIFIYRGPGASQESIRQTRASLELFMAPERLVLLGTRELLAGNWCQQAALLVMPGGRDLPYVKYLAGEGTGLIRRYVAEGGSYLGICAGAYFAAEQIVFDPGDASHPIAGKRDLGFFPGTVRGPLFFPYARTSFIGARALSLQWDPLYSWASKGVFALVGGGYFERAENYKDIKILASYEDAGKNRFPMIVHRSYGLGQVFLSQMHLEYVPQLLNAADPHLGPLIPLLQASEPLRQLFFEEMLKLLGVCFFATPKGQGRRGIYVWGEPGFFAVHAGNCR